MPAIWLLLLTLATAVPTGAIARDAAPQAPESRDLVLLLEDVLLHLRLHFMIGGQSLAEARRLYVERLVKSLDTDGDGKLSRTETARSPLFRTKRRPSASDFLQTLQSQAALSRREIEQRVELKGGNLL